MGLLHTVLDVLEFWQKFPDKFFGILLGHWHSKGHLTHVFKNLVTQPLGGEVSPPGDLG